MYMYSYKYKNKLRNYLLIQTFLSLSLTSLGGKGEPQSITVVSFLGRGGIGIGSETGVGPEGGEVEWVGRVGVDGLVGRGAGINLDIRLPITAFLSEIQYN